MTRAEFKEMCSDKDPLLAALHEANKHFGHNSDEYLLAFQALWESRLDQLKDWEIKDVMEVAKPHTQATKGLATMSWLYDRLMLIIVDRGAAGSDRQLAMGPKP